MPVQKDRPIGLFDWTHQRLLIIYPTWGAMVSHLGGPIDWPERKYSWDYAYPPSWKD